MKLLLDIGNSRIKWAFAERAGERELTAAGEFDHRDTADVGAFVERLAERPDSAAAVNVAGSALGAAVADALNRHCGCDIRFIKTSAVFGQVTNGYVAPEQLGADRWAAIVAAWERCAGECCVVDAGSATTIDVLGATGRHLGGIILPGMQLMRSALRADTSDIDEFARRGQPLADAGWLGRDTASAINRGSLFATIHAIHAAVRDFPEADAAPRLLLTGGAAADLIGELPTTAEHCPLLVLEGVRLLSEEQS